MTKARIFSGLTLSVSVILTGSVFAAGFQINELSASLQGAALSNAASAKNDVSAMTYNPATLASLKGNQLYVGVSAILPKIKYANAKANIDGIPVTNGATSNNSIAPDAYVPNGYFGWSINQKLKLGMAINAPWGLETQYASDWVGRNNAITSKLKSIAIAPTIAYQFNHYIALGAAFNIVRLNANLTNDIFTLTPTQPIFEGLKGHDWGYGYTLGMTLSPSKTTVVGLSYRSTIAEKISGDATLNVFGQSATYGTQTNIKLPAVINLGISQVLSKKWQVMANAQWTCWRSIQDIIISTPSAPLSNMRSTTLQMHWKNSWLFSVGTQYQITHQLALLAGAAYDQTPTQDQYRDPRIPDTSRVWATLGARYTINKHFEFDTTYEHIFMHNQSINVTQSPNAGLHNQVSADYQGNANIVALGIRYHF